MNMQIAELLENSKTQYHAAAQAEKLLLGAGFKRLYESKKWNVERGGKYYVVRDGSAVIAFTAADCEFFKIAAAHTDSPCFKVKLGKNPQVAGCATLNVEKYGGGLLYTWFDRPLKLCGRLCGVKNGKTEVKLFESEQKFVIPSVAIHFRRNANDGFAVNPQIDCQPLFALGGDGDELVKFVKNNFDGELLDADLYLISDEKPFFCGENGEFLCAPRVDNLTSCFGALNALTSCKNDKGVSLAYLADNEEVGSRTKQGAGSPFLHDVLKRIALSFGLNDEEFLCALAKSFLVSCDNAHAEHPCHPEYADKSSTSRMGGGVVIKHHGNCNYTTDGVSSAIFKNVLESQNVPYCDFYMRSDLPCGGTLGAISSSQVAIKSVDIGLAQLAMHSSCETFALKDYSAIINGIKAFYENYDFSSLKEL